MSKITSVSYVNPYGDYEYILVNRNGVMRMYTYKEIHMQRFHFLGLRYCAATKDSLTYSKAKR